MVGRTGKSGCSLAGRCPRGDEPAARAGSRGVAASWPSANAGTTAGDLSGHHVRSRRGDAQRLELPYIGDTSRDSRYLHGIADNRISATGPIWRFVKHGFDVVAYDSRAHGDSDGEACTYGFYEKQDLGRVLDTIATGPIVLLGTSLGAAALQHPAEDARVSAVVAAETFSDLRTVATERAPFFFSPDLIERSFQLAERHGHFRIDTVSPVAAAATITAPVLLIHGEKDSETPPDHSRRVFAALRGPKRLIIVPGAGHNGSLRADVWDEIER